MNGKILVATGHRPEKLGGYNRDTFDSLRYFAETVIQIEKPTLVIGGMAQGWDHAIATAALLAKVPLHAFIPFSGQESVWPEEAQKRYRAVLSKAEKITIVSTGGYSAHKMQLRNEAMVDSLRKNTQDTLIALWDGSNGGTSNCVRYAETRGVNIRNVWKHWLKFRNGGQLEF